MARPPDFKEISPEDLYNKLTTKSAKKAFNFLAALDAKWVYAEDHFGIGNPLDQPLCVATTNIGTLQAGNTKAGGYAREVNYADSFDEAVKTCALGLMSTLSKTGCQAVVREEGAADRVFNYDYRNASFSLALKK